MVIKKIMEELTVDGGKLVVLYVEEDQRVLRYRYLYARKSWGRNEWVRLDHTSGEPSHVHVRRKTALLKYSKGNISSIALGLSDLSDKIVDSCEVA